MTRAYIGLGANLGDRLHVINQAIEALDWGDTRVVSRSSVYETDPVGGPSDQPPFLNMVIAVETDLEPRGLFERCLAVEAALGRDRWLEQRWGPRAIDLDILVFGDQVIDEPDLLIPHPRMHERAFVLVPLAEIAPDLVVPGRGTPPALLDASGRAGGVLLFEDRF
ncbi:MAG TPA: 2-amino-4-hydroxy-6-hydroxymethyldihydropteridine diphosphokinase [Actinomycetota bacterium]